MSGTKAGVLGIVVSFVIALAPGMANASGPEIEHYRDSGSFVDTELCGFPIHVSYQDVGTLYRWFDANGNLVRFTKHSVSTDVDRANVVDVQQGDDVLTGSWIFFLPDGSHIQTAGRIQISYDEDVLSEHGPHPVAEGRLAELFCPPMS